MTEYDGLAKYYDTEWRNLKQDIEFLRDEAKKREGPVLELACGTGRIMLPLARDGHEVWGIDNSEKMLTILDRKVNDLDAELAGRLHYSAQDMRDFSFDRKFNLIIIPFNSFLLLTERSDFDICLKNCYNHLQPGGTFIVDIFSPNFELCAIKEPKIQFLQHFYDPATNKVVVQWEYAKRDMAKQLIDIDFLYEEYDRNGEVEQHTRNIKMSLIFRYEMRYLLEKSGFIVEQEFGDYDRSEIAAVSPQLIYIAKKGE
ncbi:class I SAM-dependent methyltransferase [candidate division KSB1 bacterium]